MSLRPDHDAKTLRNLMERFNSAAEPLSPSEQADEIRHQLAESQAAVADAQGITEGEETTDRVYFKVIDTVGTGMPKGYHRVKTMRPLEDGGFYIELSTPGYGMDYTRHNYKNFSLKLGSPGGRPITGQQAYDIINGKPGVAEGAPDVMRHAGDKTIRVVKKGGVPIGEIGTDADASPGNGQYYVKLYDGSYDAVGFDSAEEALAELRSAIKQMSEGIPGDIGNEIGHGIKGLKRKIQGKPSRQDVKDKYLDRAVSARQSGNDAEADKNADRWKKVIDKTNSGMMEEQGVAEAKRKMPAPEFTAYPNYAAWRQELSRRGDDQIDHLDNDYVDNYRVLFAVDRNRRVVGMYYHTADTGTFVPAGKGFSDMIYYADTDPHWPYTGDDGKEDLQELSKDTLGSYVKKASKDVDDKSRETQWYKDMWAGNYPVRGAKKRVQQKRADIDKRVSGIGQAVDRLTKEGVAEGRAGVDDTDTVGFSVNSEAAYTAVMQRFGDSIDHDETSGIMYAPARVWPQIEMTAFDADPDEGAVRVEDDVMEESDRLARLKAARSQGKSIGDAYSGLKDIKGDTGNSSERADKLKAARAQGKSISQAYSSLDDKPDVSEGKESLSQWEERMKKLGYKITKDTKSGTYHAWDGAAHKASHSTQGVAEGEEQGTFAALKGWQQWNVLIMNNFYNGRYPDYSARMYGVVASSPEEARQVVLDNADYVLKDLLSRKTPNGKRWLPPKSAVPVEDKRVGQANQAKPGSLTTMGFKTMLTPDGPKSMKFSNGQIVDIQGEESAVTENVVPAEKVSSIIKRVLGKQLQWEPGVSKLYKNTRRSQTQRVDDYVMKNIITGGKLRGRLSANKGDAVPAALKKELIQAGYPVYDDVWIFPDQIMFQVRTPITVTAEATDYEKRRARERDADAGKPVPKKREPTVSDYAKRRAKQKAAGLNEARTAKSEMERAEVQDAIARMKQRHEKEPWSLEKSVALGKKLAAVGAAKKK